MNIKRGDFDKGIYLKKLGRQVVIAVAVGGITETIAFLGTEPIPSEYVWITVIGIKALDMILNYIKHM